MLSGLESFGVCCTELGKLVRDMKPSNSGPINYANFMTEIAELQENMQDTAIWDLFRRFDGAASGSVAKKELLKALEEEEYRNSLAVRFPHVSLQKIAKEVGSNGTVSFDRFR